MTQTKIKNFLQTANLYGASISVAVSGGSDSVALFFRLYSLQNEFSLSLSIAHVNYHLRGEESDGDADFVRLIADRCGVPCYVLDSPIAIGESGIEERARIARYCFFETLKECGKCKYIAVGHTREDQVETILFRLIRGTSLHGISGMERIREDGIIRPFLDQSREECRQFLNDLGETWREDSSNSTDDYSRNLIRHKILPVLQELNSSAFEHITTFASHARNIQNDTIAIGFERLKARGLYVSPTFFHFLRAGEIDSLMISSIVALLRDRGCTISVLHAEKIVLAGSRAGKTELLPDGWRIYSSYNRLIFFHHSKDPFAQENREVFEESLYSFPVEILQKTIRTIRNSDIVDHNGRLIDASLQLKKMGVPSRERSFIPVAALHNSIILPRFR